VTANSGLKRVERLLHEALEDLQRPSREAPAARCATALAEAARELQAIAQTRPEPGLPPAAFRAQLAVLSATLRRLERLLAAAFEFYTGWCAAAPAADYPAPRYSGASGQSGWPTESAPALLAFRG
jgi:hypothetical protein